MTDYNIMVAFAGKKTLEIVSKVLSSERMRPVCACSSASELKKRVHYYQSGVIICGYKLKDSTIVHFVEDIPNDFGIILIADKTHLDLCESGRVFKLAPPIKKADLIGSVSMLLNIKEGSAFKSGKMRSDKEQQLVQSAKELLIDRYGMSEKQAYRYMQKKSMDTGVKISHIAEIILANK